METLGTNIRIIIKLFFQFWHKLSYFQPQNNSDQPDVTRLFSSQRRSALVSVPTDSYHHSEDVAMHGLMVQPLCGEQDACSWVQPEFAQAEWIGAAQERVGQFVFLVSVHGTDLQDLGARWLVFRDVHNVHLLGELWPVVVGVDDPDEHLKE